MDVRWAEARACGDARAARALKEGRRMRRPYGRVGGACGDLITHAGKSIGRRANRAISHSSVPIRTRRQRRVALVRTTAARGWGASYGYQDGSGAGAAVRPRSPADRDVER